MGKEERAVMLVEGRNSAKVPNEVHDRLVIWELAGGARKVNLSAVRTKLGIENCKARREIQEAL